jgi:hypothetical protein
LLIAALVGEELCIDYFELSLPVLGDAPGVEVQEDLSFAAEFLDEFENCFGEVEPVVVGEAVVDLFEKAVFSDF